MPISKDFSQRLYPDLRSIAEQRPTSVAELGRVGGIGGSKLNRYGQRIIELILEQG